MELMNLEDRVISRWLSGQGVRGISRSLEVPARTVKGVIREWTAGVFPVDKNEMVAKQLGRLDRMLAVVLPVACSTSGSVNLKAVTAACKLIMYQNLLLGLCQPNTAQANNNMFVQVNAVERQTTSTDKIEDALRQLIASRPKPRGEVVEAEAVEPAPADAEPAT